MENLIIFVPAVLVSGFIAGIASWLLVPKHREKRFKHFLIWALFFVPALVIALQLANQYFKSLKLTEQEVTVNVKPKLLGVLQCESKNSEVIALTIDSTSYESKKEEYFMRGSYELRNLTIDAAAKIISDTSKTDLLNVRLPGTFEATISTHGKVKSVLWREPQSSGTVSSNCLEK